MYEIQKEAKTLETLRKRAQVSYGIYAAGLLAAVIMAFVSNIIWAAVIAALILFIYILYGRGTVKTYRKQYAHLKLENELLGVLEKLEYQEQNLFSAGELEQDHILEIRPNTAVVRTGVRGKTTMGIPASLADVAFQINIAPEGSKEVIRVLTGCYMKFQTENIWNVDVCIFENGHRYREVMERYYKKIGYQKKEWKSFLIYASPNSREVPKALLEKVEAVGNCSNHNEILRFYPDRVSAIFLGRFLNYGEPDFKHQVTMEQLRTGYFPEIKAMVSLFHEK